MQTADKGSIETVLGPITKKELGFCHCHEHLFIAEGQPARINPALKIDDLEKTSHELKMYKGQGGKSIVDAQPVGCGRMVENLVTASKETSVNIIASTGFHKLVFYDQEHWIHTIDEEELVELFVSELRRGMFSDGEHNFPVYRTSAKAGIIKTASAQKGVTEEYKKLFTAGARAAQITGAPVMSHTEMGRHALQQIQTFIDSGLKANSIIICHLDRDLSDLGYHKAVAETGVYMEYDTIGRFKYHSDEAEAKHIIKMLELGYEDRILLGLDSTRERLKNYGGQIGLAYLLETFIPLLLKLGVSATSINKLLVKNPAEALVKYEKEQA